MQEFWQTEKSKRRYVRGLLPGKATVEFSTVESRRAIAFVVEAQNYNNTLDLGNSVSFCSRVDSFCLCPKHFVQQQFITCILRREVRTHSPDGFHLKVFPISIALVNEKWGFKNTNVNDQFSNPREPLLWVGGW